MPRSLLESLDPRPTTMSILHKTFNHDPATILADLAPTMMNTKFMSKTGTRSITHGGDVLNALLELPVPDTEEGTSLLRGYNATAPGSIAPRLRRRKLRSTLSQPQLKQSLAKAPFLPPTELNRQSHEILQDQQNIAVRREILNREIAGVEEKIRALEEAKDRLQQELLGLREEELELEDELEGVLSNLSRPSTSRASTSASAINTSTRRRKGPAYLPAEHDALPPHVAFTTLNYPDLILALDFSAPYDILLTSTSSSASQLNSSTTASLSSNVSFSLSLHSLKTGRQLTYLRGHTAPVRVLQVEERTAVTGGEDGAVRVWDLNALAESSSVTATANGSANPELEGVVDEFGSMNIRSRKVQETLESLDSQEQGTSTGCLLGISAHSRPITSLYFDNGSLVTSALDKTIRQWDLGTGQCILTMDVLYSSLAALDESRSGIRTRVSVGGRMRARGSLAPRSSLGFSGDVGGLGSGMGASQMGELEGNHVGALQFWGYALITGCGDGSVRMWDMRTGQSHRSLTGHTSAINALQFDETHVVTGSGDKTIRIWDLRTGTVSETITAEHPITDLQFDTRKIAYCCGENAVKIYNRTTLQTSLLTMAGHTQPVTKLRYIDRYMVSGGLDSTVKIWAL